MKTYHAIGIMSGTSLDGVDLAYCVFRKTDDGWLFDITKANTIAYPANWTDKLKHAGQLTGDQLMSLHMAYGHFLGKQVSGFINDHHIDKKDLLVASHGHTVFHKPDQGYTFQIGHGAAIAASSGCNTVSDFRSADVALGGQGAPLVPIADRQLFAKYDACLNLGGFTNISFESGGQRIAFDICPLNFVLNRMVSNAQIQGNTGLLDFDPSGHIARSGLLDGELLRKLNGIPYYLQEPPKSLGEEWVNEFIQPLLSGTDSGVEDLLHTFCHHAAFQIAEIIKRIPNCKNVLVTGGGTYNSFFIELLKDNLGSHIKLSIPDKQIIDFKEALIFAWLGVLCLRKEHNCLASVTGASKNAIGGSIHFA